MSTEHPSELRHTRRGRLPYQIAIEIHVSVHKPIPRRYDDRPWDIRQLVARGCRQLNCSLTRVLDQLDDAPEKEIVALKIFTRPVR
ncbi:MAG TPA: hypothetical protein VF713_14605, partial [Thermoanaerobaculia bacterium]